MRFEATAPSLVTPRCHWVFEKQHGMLVVVMEFATLGYFLLSAHHHFHSRHHLGTDGCAIRPQQESSSNGIFCAGHSYSGWRPMSLRSVIYWVSKLVHRRPELPAFQICEGCRIPGRGFDYGSSSLHLSSRSFVRCCGFYASTYKLPTQLLQQIQGYQALRRRRRLGLHASTRGRPDVEYVHVRDFDKKIAYAGWVEAFSESEKQRELRLRDVLVYDFEGKVLFETPYGSTLRGRPTISILSSRTESPKEARHDQYSTSICARP